MTFSIIVRFINLNLMFTLIIKYTKYFSGQFLLFITEHYFFQYNTFFEAIKRVSNK